MFWKIKTIHFVGIGGTGMSGIAEVLHNMRFKIQGSDISRSPYTQRLESMGIKIFYEHKSENVKGADLVVVSTAIKENNVEVKEAKRLNIPVIKRGVMLAELMRMKYGIAISGTHGKTTTTAMAASVFNEAGLDPTVIIGGIFQKLNSNAKLGNSEFLIAEADESDRSHLNLSPVFAIITNIDLDHLDFYKDIDDIKKTFIKFANTVPFFGSVILNADDKNCFDIIPYINKRVITFGFSEASFYRISQVKREKDCYKFVVDENGSNLGEFEIRVPGIFNILNATSVIALAREVNIQVDIIKKGLQTYSGTKRRCEVVGKSDDVTIITDYAHHPVEISKTIEALKDFYNPHRMLIVFQPHRYSRTRALFNDFINCFPEYCDVVVLPIYPAGETPIEGVDSITMARELKTRGLNCVYMKGEDDLFDFLKQNLKNYSLIAFLGAGYIDSFARKFGRDIYD